MFSRLHNITVREVGIEHTAGYDSDGFYLGLTAGGLQMENGVTLVVNTLDHPPPHVHVLVKAHPGRRFRFNLLTAEWMDPVPDGWSKKMRGFERAVKENRDVLEAWWNDYHGPDLNIG